MSAVATFKDDDITDEMKVFCGTILGLLVSGVEEFEFTTEAGAQVKVKMELVE